MNTTTVVLSAGPNGLGVVRSLYLEGVRTTVIVRNLEDVVNFSRLPEKKITLPEVNAHHSLLQILLSLPRDSIVIPTSDWFVSFLVENSAALRPHIKFLLPSEDVVKILIDKAQETEIVAGILPLPKTLTRLINVSDTLNILRLPVIVKPRSHEHMVLGAKNLILRSVADVTVFFEQYSSKLDNVLVQEIIPGDDNCQWVCNCFFDHNSNLVQAFTFNRLRLSPSHYGVTSYAVSQYNEDVVLLSKKLGKILGYVGPAMIEFKFDHRDNCYKYIELNPRLGMCNYFDTRCGINNAYAYYQLLQGNALSYDKQMKNGVVFVSLYEDVFARRKDSEKILQIFAYYLKDIFKPHVFIYHTWWDIKPSARMLLIQLRSLFQALLKKVRPK